MDLRIHFYESEGNGYVVLFDDFSDGLKTEQMGFGYRIGSMTLSGAPLDDVMVER